MSSNQCRGIVDIQRRAFELIARGTANPREITDWVRHGTENLRILGRLMRKEGTSVPLKQCYLAAIRQVKSYNKKLKSLLVRGGRLDQRERRSDRASWEDLQSAFDGRIRTGVVVNLRHVDAVDFLKDAQALFTPRIKNALKRENSLKVNAILEGEFSIIKNDEEIIELKAFNTKNVPILQTTDLNEWYTTNVQDPILRQMEEFQERDSGWTLRSIVNLTINVNQYNPMRGSSYVDIPEFIKKKEACVNVRNTDNQCFKWAVLSALHPVDRQDHPDRVAKYKPYGGELNFTGIVFPVMPRQIPQFERQNDISINVYILQKRRGELVVVPLHITSLKKDRHVNLLMIENHYADEEADERGNDVFEMPLTYHYVWIKDLSRLVSTQLSKWKVKKYICDRCLHYFMSVEKLDAHETDCRNMNQCKVKLPSPMCSKLKFKNFNNKEKVPFIVYADFECLLKSVNQQQTGKTKVCQVHEPFSVGYYVKCGYDDTLSHYDSYRGSKPAEWFARQLQQLAEQVERIFQHPVPMDALTAEQKGAFRDATICHICENPLVGAKVRDHCHLTGKYRGAAHEDCNLNYQDSRTIPVVFHNFSGYDSHLIVKEISTCIDGRIDLLPLNMERYISFTKHLKGSDISLRFIDSFRFMASSLEKLASYLTDLKILRSQFAQLDDERFELLSRKGVFPYEFLDARSKLEVKELPTKEQFYSHLSGSNITDEDYEHAERVWRKFDVKTLGEYSDLYLKTDVLLLADVFENFRDNCLEAYGLDPAHYYTTPGLTWDAMLKYTRIELELLTDIDMMMFVERGIRGGISQCSNRYARANNEYMKDYNPDEETKYLMYYDVNNLYGWAMTQHLPHGGFEWVKNLDSFDWNVPDDSPVGYTECHTGNRSGAET